MRRTEGAGPQRSGLWCATAAWLIVCGMPAGSSRASDAVPVECGIPVGVPDPADAKCDPIPHVECFEASDVGYATCAAIACGQKRNKLGLPVPCGRPIAQGGCQ